MVLGPEREWRGKEAGLRTHALVALSSALITVSALSLDTMVRRQGGDADPLRVIPRPGAGDRLHRRRHALRRPPQHEEPHHSGQCVWVSASAGVAAGAAQFTLLAVAMGVGQARSEE